MSGGVGESQSWLAQGVCGVGFVEMARARFWELREERHLESVSGTVGLERWVCMGVVRRKIGRNGFCRLQSSLGCSLCSLPLLVLVFPPPAPLYT